MNFIEGCWADVTGGCWPLLTVNCNAVIVTENQSLRFVIGRNISFKRFGHMFSIILRDRRIPRPVRR